MEDKTHFDYNVAFSRNIGWVTEAEQQALKNKTVAIAGIGGVGGSHLLTLTRLGVGSFHISDFDTFEIANFNRQAGAFMSTINHPKAETLMNLALDINPELNITVFNKGIDASNVQQFLDGADLYLDGLDFFALNARRLVFAECTKLKIPSVTAAPLGMGAAVLNFLPEHMSFEEYFCLEGRSENEQLLRFLVGLSPAMLQRSYLVDKSTVDFLNHKGPSTPMACEICAGVAATQALKILLRRGRIIYAPTAMQFDAYRNQYRKTWRPGGNRNPVQKLTIRIAKKLMPSNSEIVQPMSKDLEKLNIPPLICKIWEAGIRAPSGDNCQPWKFKLITDNKFEITIDKEKAKSFFDVNYCATYISVGAVIKNMEIAAKHFLANMDYQITIKSVNELPKINVTITPNFLEAAPAPDLYHSMRLRTVNRRPYIPKKLPTEIWKMLLTDIKVEDTKIITYAEKKEINGWIKAIKTADLVRWSHPQIHKELFNKILYTKEQAETLRAGLEIDRLGAGPGAKHIMKFLSSWSRLQTSNKIKAAYLLAQQTAFLVRSSSGLIGVWIKEDTPENWIKAGKVIEQIWVKAHYLGIEVQPLPVTIYLKRKWDDPDGRLEFQSSHAEHMSVISNTLNHFRQASNGLTCAMVFRVGKAIPMTHPAIRQMPTSFIHK